MFETFLGNTVAKSYLTQAIATNTVPHALLFYGPSGPDKHLFAQELAAHLLKAPFKLLAKETHPDFHILRPEGKSGLHCIEDIREIISQVYEAPFESSSKVFLIFDAERMQPASANALLKTLEEPTPNTTFILLTNSLSELLPTIVSRCVRVHFHSNEKTSEFPSLEEPLFQILEQNMSIPDQLAALEKVEELVEDEDPVQKRRKGESIFKILYMWMRDQYAKEVGVEKGLLFYPERSWVRQNPLPPFQKFKKKFDEAFLAYQRNIKFSVCLYTIL